MTPVSYLSMLNHVIFSTPRRIKRSSNPRKILLNKKPYRTAKRRLKNNLNLNRWPVTLRKCFHVSRSTGTWNSCVLLTSSIRRTINKEWSTLTNNGQILLALITRYLSLISEIKASLIGDVATTREDRSSNLNILKKSQVAVGTVAEAAERIIEMIVSKAVEEEMVAKVVTLESHLGLRILNT